METNKIGEPAEVSIRVTEAQPSDAEEIRAVQKITWLDTYPNDKFGITREDIQQQIETFSVDTLKNRLSNPNPSEQVWVAKVEGKIIGICCAEKGEKENILRWIYVLPKFQGKGVGTRLFFKVLEWLGEEKDIVLGVVSYNTKTIEFYKKFGFIEGGTRVDEVAKLPSGKIMPEIEMRRQAKTIVG